jgi:hypothetical protein
MKLLKNITASILALTFLAAPLSGFAAEGKKEKAKPYPLNTCAVTDEKIGTDGMDPYTFTHEGREVKLCCKDCLKEFKKDTAKYIKKIEAAEKKKPS